MRKFKSSESIKVPGSLQSIRNNLIDKLWAGAFIIAIIGAPASAMRYISTGWLSLYTIHICIALAVVIIFIFRARLSVNVKSFLLIALFSSIGTLGLLTLGVLGAGIWWLIMSVFLVSTLYSLRAGRWTVLLSTLLVVSAGYMFSNGILVVPVDVEEYVKSPSSWVSMLIATTVMPYVVFQAIASFQSATVRLLNEVDRQKKQIEMLATHDHLTGLLMMNPVNELLENSIIDAQNNSHSMSVLFIDLDGFKSINDKYGHDVGDEVLKGAARRIDSNLQYSGIAARIGGDEFLVVIPKITNKQLGFDIATNIINDVSKEFGCGDISIQISASVGISFYPEHGESPKQLRKAADEAMYRAKNAGKNQMAVAT